MKCHNNLDNEWRSLESGKDRDSPLGVLLVGESWHQVALSPVTAGRSTAAARGVTDMIDGYCTIFWRASICPPTLTSQFQMLWDRLFNEWFLGMRSKVSSIKKDPQEINQMNLFFWTVGGNAAVSQEFSITCHLSLSSNISFPKLCCWCRVWG